MAQAASIFEEIFGKSPHEVNRDTNEAMRRGIERGFDKAILAAANVAKKNGRDDIALKIRAIRLVRK